MQCSASKSTYLCLNYLWFYMTYIVVVNSSTNFSYPALSHSISTVQTHTTSTSHHSWPSHYKLQSTHTDNAASGFKKIVAGCLSSIKSIYACRSCIAGQLRSCNLILVSTKLIMGGSTQGIHAGTNAFLLLFCLAFRSCFSWNDFLGIHFKAVAEKQLRNHWTCLAPVEYAM